MFAEIMSEIRYWFLLMVILFFGLAWCDVSNREIFTAEWLKNYEYNIDPKEGSVWIDSIVDKTKFK